MNRELPPQITRRIPIAAPDLSGNEQAYVLQAVQSTWNSSAGEFLTRFEREFAAACETRFALGTNNGTTALHPALETLGLGDGDEVLVPSMTYIATVNAVSYCRARPVFIDIDPDTWCIDPGRLEAAITPRTKGIIPVHLLGHPADMDAINAVAARHDLWVVEDAAEAPFATYRGRTVGSLGQAASFSFFGNKILTAGEGGRGHVLRPSPRDADADASRPGHGPRAAVPLSDHRLQLSDDERGGGDPLRPDGTPRGHARPAPGDRPRLRGPSA